MAEKLSREEMLEDVEAFEEYLPWGSLDFDYHACLVCGHLKRLLAEGESRMTREDVYAAIDGERDYQDRKWGPLSERHHEVGAWLAVLQVELTEAFVAWCKAPGDKAALEEVRQVAAVAVACLEQHGAPSPRN